MTTTQTNCQFTGTTCDNCPSPGCYYAPDNDDLDVDWGDDDDRCEGEHSEDEECPLCCGNGGWYQPGTEECDFCQYETECATFQREKLKREGLMR